MDAEVTPLHGGAPHASETRAADAIIASDPSAPNSRADVAVVAAAFAQVDAAHRRLRSRLAHRLGVTVTDLTALTVISEDDECTPKRLAAELGVTSGTATSIIDRLVESGQVHREPKLGDRRSILIELTAAGDATIATVSGLYVGAISLALESSPHVVNRHILDSLRSTADALDGADDGAAETHASASEARLA